MKIAIYGCTGRVGRELIRYIMDNNYILFAAITKICNKYIGKDAAELINYNNSSINITDDIREINGADFVIDFSTTDASIILAEYANLIQIPHIIGTTGFNDDQINYLSDIAKNNKIFLSSNMSFGINLINQILYKMSKYLDDFDINIIETHHKYKKDAPSGTALMLADSIKSNEINFHSIRAGSIFGEHEITFTNDSEMISFKHIAFNREIFAKNSIIIAKWLIKQKNGLYNINDFMPL